MATRGPHWQWLPLVDNFSTHLHPDWGYRELRDDDDDEESEEILLFLQVGSRHRRRRRDGVATQAQSAGK